MPLEKRAQESSGRRRSIHPYYHRVFMSDFSITSHTIVTISQRPPQRVKSESFFQALSSAQGLRGEASKIAQASKIAW